MDELMNYSEETFESIKHVNEYGQEFWFARELQAALEYAKWDNFKKVIDKAMESCEGASHAVSDHFADAGKIVEAGAKVRQTIKELGGTMPEDLPTPDKSIKQLEREEQKKLKD